MLRGPQGFEDRILEVGVEAKREASIPAEKRQRRLIALDETCVGMNGLEYRVYSAVDVERNEGLSHKKHHHHDVVLRGVLGRRDGRPSFHGGRGAPSFEEHWGGFKCIHSHIRWEELVESVFSSYKA